MPGDVRLQSYVYTRGVRTIAGKNTSDGFWHHVAWSLDGQTGLALYVDGKIIDVASEKGNCGVGCSDFATATRYLIGAAPGQVDGLTGSIDDVQLYQIPLTTKDIETLYEAQK